MATQKLINKRFTQLGNICVTASYGIVIEYFSKGKIKIEHVLGRYVDRFNVFPDSTKVYYFREKHELICDHFHNYCGKRSMRGFEFIKLLHEGNDLKTKDYCNIIDSKSSLQVIDNQTIQSIRNILENCNALAMVLYKVSENQYHAVTVGYDSNNKSYFYKDPSKPTSKKDDILSQKAITEFIVFGN